jgi:hypothetical protein
VSALYDFGRPPLRIARHHLQQHQGNSTASRGPRTRRRFHAQRIEQTWRNRKRLQSYDLIRHIAGQSLVKVRETPDRHIGNQLVRDAALVATMITAHQEDVLLARDLGQALSQRIPHLKHIAVIFEEEHGNHLGPVPTLLQLG